MATHKKFNLTHYLVIGPENTLERDPLTIIEQAIRAGITFIQIRAKTLSAKETIALTVATAEKIAAMGKQDEVSLVVNDRLDIVLAARAQGAKVDGIHVGQEDIPAAVCRHYLGKNAIIGLSAGTQDIISDISQWDLTTVDYLGVAPLHQTATKPDAGMTQTGEHYTRQLVELKTMKQLTELPIVVGGGVTAKDLPHLVTTGADGYFVVSAITQADDPFQAAQHLVTTWERAKGVE